MPDPNISTATGKVRNIQIFKSSALTWIDDFPILLWDDFQNLCEDRVVRSMWLSLLEHALINDLDVRVSHATDSIHAGSVTLVHA